MRIIDRKHINLGYCKEILDKETHHNHLIVEDANGVLRWKENPVVNLYLSKISLNDLLPLLMQLGFDKNSEVYRKLYRDMGYSLYGYWEIFYFSSNNPNKKKYKPSTNAKRTRRQSAIHAKRND